MPLSRIKRFSGLAETEVRLLSHAVLASWVVEFTEVPICIALVGSPSHERRQLLRLLRCLLRRALPLSEASLAGLCSLPMELAPTLLIERCEPTSQFLRFLEATRSQDAQIVSKGRILKASCAKVLCVEEVLDDSLFGCLLVEIPGANVVSSRTILDRTAQEQIVKEFQPKLEMFRLINYGLVHASDFDAPELSSGTRDLARCLGSAVAGDSELQTQLVAVLKKQDVQPVRAEYGTELRALVAEALLACSHQPEKQNAGVAEITRLVNETLQRRGELLALSPRAVGNILRGLGLSTSRLSATRRGIVLLNSVRQHIHRLAGTYNLLEARSRPDICQQCVEAEVTIELDKELAKRIDSLPGDLENPFA